MSALILATVAGLCVGLVIMAFVLVLHEIDNYARAGNRLYRESMEDQQARTLQAALLLKNARRDVDDAYRVLNQKGETR